MTLTEFLRFAIAASLRMILLCNRPNIWAVIASTYFVFCFSVGQTMEPIAVGAPSAAAFAYIADLKPSFPEHELYSPATALTSDNYRAVLHGLKYNAGVNGIRLPIDPNAQRASDVSSLYRQVYAYARQLGLTIYASPLSVGFTAYDGWTDDRYASWLADYANVFQPDILSPFNEAGIDADRMARIVWALKAKLSTPVKLAGPDRQHVKRTIEDFSQHNQTASLFDIVDSHNANLDFSANRANWAALVSAARGKPVWSSENPATWGQGNRDGLPGLDQAILGGVNGIVIWLAKPTLVDDDGEPTAKAAEIAAHLGQGHRTR